MTTDNNANTVFNRFEKGAGFLIYPRFFCMFVKP